MSSTPNVDYDSSPLGDVAFDTQADPGYHGLNLDLPTSHGLEGCNWYNPVTFPFATL